MGYDCGYSFPFESELNGFPFCLKSKENCHHNHIPFNLEGNGILVHEKSQRIFLTFAKRINSFEHFLTTV